MLVLSRKKQENIRIDGNIVIRVLAIDGKRVRLGIDAPEGVKIVRDELLALAATQSKGNGSSPTGFYPPEMFHEEF